MGDWPPSAPTSEQPHDDSDHHQGRPGIEDLPAVADGTRVKLDDGARARITGGRAAVDRAPVTSTVSSSWPPQAPIGRPPSNDETQSANSSHPNTTGYQFSSERAGGVVVSAFSAADG